MQIALDFIKKPLGAEGEPPRTRACVDAASFPRTCLQPSLRPDVQRGRPRVARRSARPSSQLPEHLCLSVFFNFLNLYTSLIRNFLWRMPRRHGAAARVLVRGCCPLWAPGAAALGGPTLARASASGVTPRNHGCARPAVSSEISLRKH